MEILDYKFHEVKSDGLKREFKVTVQAEPIAKIVSEKLKKERETFEMPGFRKGNAPESFVRKQLGPKVIRETIEQEVDKVLRKIFEEKDYKPAGQPHVNIDQFEDSKKDLVIEVKMEILPDAPKVDFSKISVERVNIKVSDEDMQNAYNEILSNFKTYDSAGEKPISHGDAAIIDFEGKVGGEDFEGNRGEGIRLEVGSGQFIPGFEDQLIGHRSGDKVDVKVKFPKGYPEKKVAGKDAVFHVKINDVLKPEKVEAIDDDFAKKLGLEDVEKLREMLEGKLIMDYQSLTRLKIKKDAFDKIDSEFKFDIPQSMVDMDLEAMWSQVRAQMKKDSESFKGRSEEQVKAEYRKIAERRVRLGILLSEVAREESIDVSEEDLQQAIFTEAMQKPGQESLVIEFYSKPENRERLKGPILEEKAFDHIMTKLNVTDIEMNSKEFFDKYSRELSNIG